MIRLWVALGATMAASAAAVLWVEWHAIRDYYRDHGRTFERVTP